MPSQTPSRPRKGETTLTQQVEGVDTYINVMEASVAAYQRHGWTRVDDGNSETDPEFGADDHTEGEDEESEFPETEE